MCRLACKTAECCCIFSRQTGGKLIGFFYIILFFFSMLGPVIELHKHRSISFQDDDDDGEAKVVESEDANIFVLMEQTRRSGHVDVKTAMIFLIISLLIGLLINVLMVWGIYMKFCWFLLPWLLFQIAFVTAQLTCPFFSIYYADYETIILTVDSERWLVFLALFPIGLGVLGIYFWFIIRQLFNDFDEASKVKPPETEKGDNALILVKLAMEKHGTQHPTSVEAPLKRVD